MLNTTRRKTLLSLTFFCCINAYSTDTLTTESDYPSPISNPTAIDYYNGFFWIANLSSPKVYKLDSDMILTDSIEFHRSRICGISHKNGRLWVSVDEPAPYVVTATNDVPYRIYEIDVSSKTVSDSLFFKIGGTSHDTGLIYGLGIMNDTFFISLNMGFSSGIYSIDSEETQKLKSYLPLSGLTAIGNELWGIRRNADIRNGNLITSLTKDDSLAIRIDVNGSDIAYDGNNIFVCNPDQSRIHKLIALKVPTINRIKRNATGEPQSAFKVIAFSNEQTVGNRTSLFTLNGQIAGFSRRDNQALASQVIIGFDIKRRVRK